MKKILLTAKKSCDIINSGVKSKKLAHDRARDELKTFILA